MSQTSEVFNISPDIQIHYRIDDFTDGWVDAPTVLMLHGIGESTDAFTGWVPHLARLCKVIRVDLRGFGKSSPISADQDIKLNDFSNDIEKLIEHLKLDKVHLIGAKLGAQIGMQLAQNQPSWLASMTIAGILISPAGALGNWVEKWISMVDEGGTRNWAELTMPGRMGTALSSEATEWWTNYMGQTSSNTAIACFRMLPSMTQVAVLENITSPCLVIVAADSSEPNSDSQRQSTSAMRTWQERIPNSKLVEINTDSYHVAATHPDECAILAQQFISSL